MRLAIIPARGGSKRIPRKNIKDFCGKPMIAWSILSAIESGCFDQVAVSTDDLEIADVAIRYGAAVPFIRPAELSDDHTGTIPVIQHAIRKFEAAGQPAAEVCCIYATAPFLTAEDLRNGMDLLLRNNCSYAFSVTSYAFPIQRAIRLSPAGRTEMFDADQFGVRSQDLEAAFHDAGQFYWGRTDAWLSGEMIFGMRSVPVILPRHRVQDIDTPEDWTRAEWMFKAMQASCEGKTRNRHGEL